MEPKIKPKIEHTENGAVIQTIKKSQRMPFKPDYPRLFFFKQRFAYDNLMGNPEAHNIYIN